MYIRTQLKEKITQDDEWIECHVRNCIHKVLRQRRNIKTMENFLCPVHNIYLSPTTFDYKDYMMNLLSKDSEDIQLLEKIFNKKIEDRLAKIILKKL
ncbi:hypothetical protein [Fictibacillus sp. JL2B1089]|uniref:hypothetical protein n=1 Tax=Fictibacillus sp. JL2B1089 TaxID=3399565 RepID=UPI003A85C81E